MPVTPNEAYEEVLWNLRKSDNFDKKSYIQGIRAVQAFEARKYVLDLKHSRTVLAYLEKHPQSRMIDMQNAMEQIPRTCIDRIIAASITADFVERVPLKATRGIGRGFVVTKDWTDLAPLIG